MNDDTKRYGKSCDATQCTMGLVAAVVGIIVIVAAFALGYNITWPASKAATARASHPRAR